MAKNLRTPYQGVWNIVRFNWHFYLLAAALIGLLLIIAASITPPVATLLLAAAMLIAGSTVCSLLVSYYIYDHSNLYELHWLNDLTIPKGATIINIHAGFDETSTNFTSSLPTPFFLPEAGTMVCINTILPRNQRYSSRAISPSSNIVSNLNSFLLLVIIIAIRLVGKCTGLWLNLSNGRIIQAFCNQPCNELGKLLNVLVHAGLLQCIHIHGSLLHGYYCPRVAT